MELCILRHAIAVERGTTGYGDDSERPLTPEGRAKMRQGALGMKALELSFDLILTSPYARTRETAAIVAKTFKLKDDAVTLTDNLLPGASFEKLVREINAHSPQNVLLVGHEPDLSELISFLLIGVRKSFIDLKKGGLCNVSTARLTAGKCAVLNWLLTPAQLRVRSP